MSTGARMDAGERYKNIRLKKRVHFGDWHKTKFSDSPKEFEFILKPVRKP